MDKAHFVIVQTQEAQGPVLSVVPQRWVKSDGLMWPNKNAAFLSKDASSKPTPSWTKFPCIVKKRNIPSYEQAQQEAADLSGQSTDASDYAPRKKQKKKIESKGYDFNHMLSQGPSNSKPSQSSKKQLMTPNQITPGQPSRRPIPQGPVVLEQMHTSVNPATSVDPALVDPTIPVEPAQYTQVIDQSEVSLLSGSEVAVLLESVQEVGQNAQTTHAEVSYHAEYLANEGQQMPLENCENSVIQAISEKLEQASERIVHAVTTKIEASLAKTVALIKSDFDLKIQAALRVRHENDPTDSNFKFSPASTVEEIKQLETDLADASYQNKLINYMRKIIGPNGDSCNGQNMCYLLVDCFFQRKAMTNCSWSGGSKSNVPKYAIKDCKNILEIFFRIIHSVNPTFSVKLLEDFFKQILRNAKTRCQAKGLRQSTIHRRVKKAKMCSRDEIDSDHVPTYGLKHEALDLDVSDNIEEESVADDYDEDKENTMDDGACDKPCDETCDEACDDSTE